MTVSPMSRNPALWGAGYMTAAGAVFATTNTLVQYATMRLGAPPAGVAFVQYLAAALCFAPWIATQGAQALRTRQLGWHLLRVALSAVGVQFWVAGLATVPIWQAIALIMTAPFFVTIGAAALLGERVGPLRLFSVVAGLIGGAVILAPWSDAFATAALNPVAAAICWAMVSLMTKRMSATDSPETLTLYLLVLLVPVNGVAFAASGWAAPAGLALALVAAAGILTAAAQYLIARAYRVADAAFIQPFDHIKLLFNVGLGAAVFGYLPPGRLWLGAALIVGASSLLLERERR